MKVAFDEHIPPLILQVFQTLEADDNSSDYRFVSARHYAVPRAPSDVPWIQRFRDDDGRVIISGDKRMRSMLIERDALEQAGMITFFFRPQWNRANRFVRAAMLLNWWPKIDEQIQAANAGDSFEIPYQWNHKPFKNVTHQLDGQQTDNIVDIRNRGT